MSSPTPRAAGRPVARSFPGSPAGSVVPERQCPQGTRMAPPAEDPHGHPGPNSPSRAADPPPPAPQVSPTARRTEAPGHSETRMPRDFSRRRAGGSAAHGAASSRAGTARLTAVLGGGAGRAFACKPVGVPSVPVYYMSLFGLITTDPTPASAVPLNPCPVGWGLLSLGSNLTARGASGSRSACTHRLCHVGG